jgi:hypothetical protein
LTAPRHTSSITAGENMYVQWEKELGRMVFLSIFRARSLLKPERAPRGILLT